MISYDFGVKENYFVYFFYNFSFNGIETILLPNSNMKVYFVGGTLGKCKHGTSPCTESLIDFNRLQITAGVSDRRIKV